MALKRIGFFNEGMYFIDSRGKQSTSDIFLIFFQNVFKNHNIISLGRLSPICFSPNHKLDKGWKLFPLSYYKSILDLLFIFPYYYLINRSSINKFIDSIDVLFISPSGPLSILLLKKIINKNKDVVLFIRQDTRKLIAIKNKNNFFAKMLGDFIDSYIEKFVNNSSNATVFTFGGEIYKRYSRLSDSVYSIADSRYNESDIINPNEIEDKSYSRLKLLYVGRLAPGKGLEFLIRFLSSIFNFEFSFTIVGDGALRGDLVHLVKELGLSNKVEFLGHIPFSRVLLNVYSSHDVFIMPSFSEGLPQVVFEAMSQGSIVVATNVGGIPDQIEHKVTGFLFDPGSENQLKLILNDIILGQVDLMQIRKNALRVAKEYSFENQRDLILRKTNLNKSNGK